MSTDGLDAVRDELRDTRLKRQALFTELQKLDLAAQLGTTDEPSGALTAQMDQINGEIAGLDERRQELLSSLDRLLTRTE